MRMLMLRLPIMPSLYITTTQNNIFMQQSCMSFLLWVTVANVRPL